MADNPHPPMTATAMDVIVPAKHQEAAKIILQRAHAQIVHTKPEYWDIERTHVRYRVHYYGTAAELQDKIWDDRLTNFTCKIIPVHPSVPG